MVALAQFTKNKDGEGYMIYLPESIVATKEFPFPHPSWLTVEVEGKTLKFSRDKEKKVGF